MSPHVDNYNISPYRFIATAGPSLQDHDDDESHNAEDSSDLETDAKDVESHHDRADDYCTRMVTPSCYGNSETLH